VRVEGETGFRRVAEVAKGVDVEVGEDFEDEFVGDKGHRVEVPEAEKVQFGDRRVFGQVAYSADRLKFRYHGEIRHLRKHKQLKDRS